MKFIDFIFLSNNIQNKSNCITELIKVINKTPPIKLRIKNRHQEMDSLK